MQRLLSCITFIAAMAVLNGCEWSSPDDSGSWSSSYTWINFAGTYTPAAGATYLVSDYAPQTSTPASTQSTSQSLGTSDGLITATFSGTLANLPVAASVVVRAGSWVLTDSAADGNLTGTTGSGTVNYSTGLVTVNWNAAPAAGVNTIVTYNYSIAGTPANPSAASSPAIYSLILSQTGQQLVATDSNGMTYSGRITGVSQGGGDTTGATSGSVVANFALTGSNGSRIVGTLNGTYTAPSTGTGTTTTNPAATGTLANRTMTGTYVGPGGGTGNVQGSSGTVTVSTATTTTGA